MSSGEVDLIHFDDSGVVYSPPVAESMSGWHKTSQMNSRCGSFSTVNLQLPNPGTNPYWKSHTISFNFTGTAIYLYGGVDSTYSWDVSIDGGSRIENRYMSYSIFGCSPNIYNQTGLSNGQHSLTLTINPVDQPRVTFGQFTFEYAMTKPSSGSWRSSTSPPVPVQTHSPGIPHNERAGHFGMVFLVIVLPILLLCSIIGGIAFFIRRRKQRQFLAHFSGTENVFAHAPNPTSGYYQHPQYNPVPLRAQHSDTSLEVLK